MTKRFLTGALLLIFAAICSAAQQGGGQASSGSEYVGTWSGSWEMAPNASGGFELILEKGKDGALAGRVSVTGEPTYKATLKTIAFDGKKMTAAYDFPPDERLEIALATTFDGSTAKGTWAARAKDGSGEVASGSWTVTRK
ncbi:MAG TPA: hypothetical protein VH740_19070 [Vicinamibacterales bacterium]|jgi:hypothetical protein